MNEHGPENELSQRAGQLPPGVASAMRGRPRRTRPGRASPYGLDPRINRRPRVQWALLYGPPLGMALLFLSVDNGAEDLWVGALLVTWPLLLAAMWRVPQELRRGTRRAWRVTDDGQAHTWFDPSGEWKYSRLQSPFLPPVVGLVLGVASLAAWVAAYRQGGTIAVLWLPLVVAALVYVHRHLPTQMHPRTAQQVCENCTAKPGSEFSPRLCPRCGRVRQLLVYPAVPSLQRRLRDV